MVFAEKILAAVERGTANTRWRDFADVWLLSGRNSVAGTDLQTALERVAAHRGIDRLPLHTVLDGYVELAQSRWQRWRDGQALDTELRVSFAAVLSDVVAFADRALEGTVAGHRWTPAQRRWQPPIDEPTENGGHP